MASESIRFDFLSTGAGRLAGDFKKTGDNAAAAARGAKVLQDTIHELGQKENRTAEESARLAKALRLTGDAEDRAAAKALAADIAIRRLADAEQDAAKKAGQARGGFAGLAGEVTGFGAASTAASGKSSLFSRALAGINLATGVLEPALAGVAVVAGGLAAAFAAAGAGAAAYGVALSPLLAQTQDVTKAQETLDKARATAQANYAAALKSGVSAKTADAARTKAMTTAQEKYNQAVKGTPAPVRQFAGEVSKAKNTYKAWADSLARPVLGPLSMGLKIVGPALKAITPLVRVTAGAFGMLVTEISRKVSAGGLTSVVSTLLPHVRDTILDLAHSAGNVAAGIWGILKAFLPVSGQITGGVVKLTARFREWANSLPSHTGFQSLMAMFKEQTPQALAILKNLGTVLLNVGKAMTGLSTFSNSKMLLNALLPLSGVLATLSRNQALDRIVLYLFTIVAVGKKLGPAFAGVKAAVAFFPAAAAAVTAFAGVTEGATVAQVIAAAATRAWGLAMSALPWVALAAAVVVVAVLIIKYHRQIWAFVQRVWHDVLAVIMAAWNWVKSNWPLLLGILTGPIGLAVVMITKHWRTLTTGIAALFDIAKENIRIIWDKIKILFLGGVDAIMRTMGKLPGPLGAPFRAAHKTIAGELAGIQRDVGSATRNIQADWDRIHGKTVRVNFVGSGSGSIAFKQSIPGVTTGPSSQGILGFHAAGGMISGGTPGKDSVLGMLMPGEVIVPTGMVAAGEVDHLRGRLPGFAAGGMITGMGAADRIPAAGEPFMAKAEAAFGRAVEGAFAKAVIAKFKKDAAAALSGSGGAIADYAMSFLGKLPYVWGGTSLTSGADCSGFVQAIYKHFGIGAPRTSEAQGAWVRRSGPQPGGLAFYHSPAGGPDPGHVAIVRSAAQVISQGGGMGPTLIPLHALPLLWTGVPPGGLPSGGGGGVAGAGRMSAQQIAALWTADGGPAFAAANMARIAFAESGDRPGAVQTGQPPGLTGYGLYQITPTSGIRQNGAFGNLLNASNNTRAAISLFSQSGYRPWASDPVGRQLAAAPFGYADGTPAAAPGWAVVGERGPELVRFRGGEQVVPGYASGGQVGAQGSAYLKAWQTRHGGGFGAAWGPVVVNQQIAAMNSALHRAQTLAGAHGLSAAQHKHWAFVAADEKKRLATLNRELTTERSWRAQLGTSDTQLAGYIRAAGNAPSLRGNVTSWKTQLSRQKATIGNISKMLGYSDSWLKAHPPPPVLPKVTHTYGGDVADTIGAVLAAALGPFTGATVMDRGGWLKPGFNSVYNGTGRPEPVGAARGGGTIRLEISGGQSEFDQFMLAWMKKHAKIKGGGSVQVAFGSR